MIAKILAALSAFIISVISSMGYSGIVLLMAIESACIPLPSEVIMPFSGYLVSQGRFNLWWVATAGAIGCNLGSVVAYELGYFGGRPLVERFGRWIWISRHELELADRFFGRYGNLAVFISRLLPVIRTFIALPAGVARMPRIPFHIYTFLGSWPWCLGLAYVGQVLGEQWDKDPRLKEWFHRLDAVIAVVLLAGIIWFVWSRWKNRIVVSPDAAGSRSGTSE
jgi:membrane protein DedA with SNARE-associated domain